jgi:hypothetical protein
VLKVALFGVPRQTVLTGEVGMKHVKATIRVFSLFGILSVNLWGQTEVKYNQVTDAVAPNPEVDQSVW